MVGGSVPDPAPRIGMLEAANTKPVSVKLDTDLKEDRKIENVANLTFGEYIRLLDTAKNWGRLYSNWTGWNALSDCERSAESVTT